MRAQTTGDITMNILDRKDELYITTKINGVFENKQCDYVISIYSKSAKLLKCQNAKIDKLPPM
jgi:hypothetical protein